jgi:hypothetical protein
MSKSAYWAETIAQAAEDVNLTLTEEQLECLAGAVEISHDNYGLAFYSPPASDYYDRIESEWSKKYKDLEREFEKYKRNAETAVGQALRQRHDTPVRIGDNGEVFRIDGRTTQIQ